MAEHSPVTSAGQPYVLIGETASIQMPCGLWFLIDRSDLAAVGAYRWTADRRERGTYVRTMLTIRPGRGGKREPLYLHRLLTKPAAGLVVDHRNHDGLDNRRENLRLCTVRENTRHSRGNGTKGTKWNSSSSSWIARIGVPGEKRSKCLYLGLFAEREWAARAYDAAALRIYGDFAVTNYPKCEYDASLIAEINRRRVGLPRRNSNYRGVWPHGRKWGASIRFKNVQKYIGLFCAPDEAARAYDREAFAAHGLSAVLNFPHEYLTANDSTNPASEGGQP